MTPISTRTERTGRVTITGPLSTRDATTRLLLEFFAMLAIVGAALVWIGYLAEGFRPAPGVVVPVERDDAPASEAMP